MNNAQAKPKAFYSAPMKETPATVRDVINVKTALSVVLAEETAHMDAMRMDKVKELQDRKLKLIGLLERYMRYLQNHPEKLAEVTPEEKAQLSKTGDEFRNMARKNYDTLLVARAVNGAIVKCITQTVTKKDNPVYNARGNVGYGQAAAVSVTLNQTI